jgi:hypothetical protein
MVRCPRFTLSNWFEIISAFLIPVLIGIITVILSTQQNNISQANRLTDLEIAHQQREKDQKSGDIYVVKRSSSIIYEMPPL